MNNTKNLYDDLRITIAIMYSMYALIVLQIAAFVWKYLDAGWSKYISLSLFFVIIVNAQAMYTLKERITRILLEININSYIENSNLIQMENKKQQC